MLRSTWRTMRTRRETKVRLERLASLGLIQSDYARHLAQTIGPAGLELLENSSHTLSRREAERNRELERLTSYLYSIAPKEEESVILFTWDGARSTERYEAFLMDKCSDSLRERLLEKRGVLTRLQIFSDQLPLEPSLRVWRCLELNGLNVSLQYQRILPRKK